MSVFAAVLRAYDTIGCGLPDFGMGTQVRHNNLLQLQVAASLILGWERRN